jgi:ATP-binding protein involved in chromosome partitioning
MNIQASDILKALQGVIFHDKKKDIVSLEMVENIKIDGHHVSFDLILPANSAFKKSLEKSCISTLQAHVDAALEVSISFPAPKAAKPATEKSGPLPNVKNIIAVASGKGGVGKSTVATNLAVALALNGYKVGLMDADIFGPSVPKMFNVENERPELKQENGKDLIVPIEKYGVKLLSIGFFVDQDKATVWRGPMASSAFKQLISEGDWGELDYFLIDLPPGTSDIHLTLVQTLPVNGAIIVSTPQAVALADVVKGINMFQNDGINVPVLGLVENMAWFTPAELPENKYYIFGKEGCKQLSEHLNIPLLGQIPLVQSICESGDKGAPAALNTHSITGQAFHDLAEKVAEQVDIRNRNLPQTKVVEIK